MFKVNMLYVLASHGRFGLMYFVRLVAATNHSGVGNSANSFHTVEAERLHMECMRGIAL
jgi:hypothetical protein